MSSQRQIESKACPHPAQRNDVLETCFRDCPFLAIYGGGDAMSTAVALKSCTISNTSSLDDLLLDNLIRDAQAAHRKWSSIASTQEIVTFPEVCPIQRGKTPIDWSLSIFRAIDVSRPHNIFFQGWLYDGQLSGRLGASRYPLIGLYDSFNLAHFVSESEPSEFCPTESLSPADQHVHLVEEVLDLDGFSIEMKDWHFGANMARLLMSEREKPASCFAVCVDLERNRIHVNLFFLFGPNQIYPERGQIREVLMSISSGRLLKAIEMIDFSNF